MNVEQLLSDAETLLQQRYLDIDRLSVLNQRRVLDAFRLERVSDFHLQGSTGYGYGDSGRDAIENIFARIFGGEDALVRGHFASGTHAISCALFGALRPGDHLLVASGTPYDTLHGVIGIGAENRSSLKAWGVAHGIVPLAEDGELDMPAVLNAITSETKVLYIQRSRGYNWRPALGIEAIGRAIALVKEYRPDIVSIVDNCYGEFVEEREPGHVGADLTVGSLIKNPGGGLALSGGYIVGRADLVADAADALYAPGIGGKVGASTVFNRSILQGIFMAPAVVAAGLKGAVLLAQACELLGLQTSPGSGDFRSDIIQAIRMPSREALIRFCQGVQSASPVDSHVAPIPGPLPGYDTEVIMAAGTFVLGASSELSADAPLREPYTVYVQGGLSYPHVRVALEIALRSTWSDIYRSG